MSVGKTKQCQLWFLVRDTKFCRVLFSILQTTTKSLRRTGFALLFIHYQYKLWLHRLLIYWSYCQWGTSASVTVTAKRRCKVKRSLYLEEAHTRSLSLMILCCVCFIICLKADLCCSYKLYKQSTLHDYQTFYKGNNCLRFMAIQYEWYWLSQMISETINMLINNFTNNFKWSIYQERKKHCGFSSSNLQFAAFLCSIKYRFKRPNEACEDVIAVGFQLLLVFHWLNDSLD